MHYYQHKLYILFIMTFGFYQMRLMGGRVASTAICIYARYNVNIDWLTQLLLGYTGCNCKLIFVEKVSIICITF